MASGLLLLRLAVGGIMAAHGAQKLFGWWGGPGMAGTTGMCMSFGCRLPGLMAWPLALAAIGPGRFSIDHALGWNDNLSGFWWGVAVAGAALVASFLTLTIGRRRPRAVELPA
jgi:putative oxidoreductase